MSNGMKKTAFILFLIFFVALVFQISKASAFSFAVIGDTQKFTTGRNGAFRQAIKNISSQNAAFTIPMGDFCSGKKCAKKLRTWKKIASPLFPNIYPVHGNHDQISSSDWISIFNPPMNGPNGYLSWTYSFDYDNSHFVVLDSDRSKWHLIDQTQRDWLEQDLALNRKKKHKFIFFHAPAYPASLHIGSSLDAYPTERDALWEILDRHKVSAVFVGHEHFFNRRLINSSVYSGAANSIYQFTVGRTDVSETYSAPQAGMSEYYSLEKSFAIVNAKKKSVKIDLYSTSGNLLHSFRYKK